MNQITVTVGNNATRTTVIVSSNETLRSVLEENDIEYTRGTMHLDGTPLPAGSLDKTFDDFNVTTKCSLFSIAKADNA